MVQRPAAVVVLAACATAPVRPVVRHSDVHVAASTCASPETHARIARVLAEHHAELAGLVVDITTTPRDDGGAAIALRVVRPSGEVGLDRTYTLAANECASAPELLALGVDRWLTAFPEWAVPPPPEPAAPERWLDVLARGTVAGIAPPLGVEGALGAIGDYGGVVDRVGGSVLVRSGPAQAAGSGRFREIALLAGAEWRHRWPQWDLGVELRGGVLRVSGLGFAINDASWIKWWEAAASFGRRFGRATVALEVAATTLRDHAVTRDGLVSQNIPLVRAGISLTFALVSR